MVILKRFYCSKCKKFEDRIQVKRTKLGYRTDFWCRSCGSHVEETSDILSSMIKDYTKEEE